MKRVNRAKDEQIFLNFQQRIEYRISIGHIMMECMYKLNVLKNSTIQFS